VVGWLTAMHFLRKANIGPGQKVLIYGASGSVGTAAVQIAKHFGAEVTGVCGSTNLEMVKSIGADRVIDYTESDFTKGGETFDVIFDTVGKSSFAGSVRCLNPKGFLLLGAVWKMSWYLRALWISITSSKKVIHGIAGDRIEDLDFVKERIEAGEFKPVIDRRYPFEQIPEAHRYVEKGHKKGNVVITLDRDLSGDGGV
ncbi:MAG: NAD(P)-dependent alcohol dehydrogenase, partial [Candidatus Latescibacterota bacterium]